MPSLMSYPAKYEQYIMAAFYRRSGLTQRVDAYLAASNSLIHNKKRELGLPENKFVLTALAPAISTETREREATPKTLEQFGLSPGYMLDVASNSEKKNVINLINAVNLLREKGQNVPVLVVAGEWEGTETHAYGNRKLGPNVVFTGYVENDTLADLYNGAGMYVNPTRHETFGLTNLEAMAAGLPIITSNRFAVPEVVGDAALLIDDPEDTGEIADKIQYVVESPKVRAELSSKAKTRATQYTWEHTVDKIISTFRDLK